MLEVAGEGMIELVLPDLVVTELQRVLGEKLGLEPEVLDRIHGLLDELPGETVPTPASADELSDDRDDDRILAAALAAGADALISGDRRHLLPLGEVGGMPTLRPQDLLARLLG